MIIRRLAHLLRYLRRPKPVYVPNPSTRRGLVYMTQPTGYRCPCGSAFCGRWGDA